MVSDRHGFCLGIAADKTDEVDLDLDTLASLLVVCKNTMRSLPI